ncbi:hypothetical protein JHK82_040157 [Glycine max]|uniref:Uncharacterized protein n=2 Tax=Glycine subgen. Soja TaxID=1462606 RepID=K7M7C0_SOYBN|nr:hypothetical protein JHK87_040164 [Glycine soja]KAG4963490.1 hypothetical protein JHK86_040358 [Glycine max]KAG4965970.1 hypothetical protein JHK85_040945 [Glycine max]KAG5110934.1 hypothetical protein JHK82_040157 [Glycine max]KAG5122226.1 hypothetical protein JHK84_040566 [Glycine max]
MSNHGNPWKYQSQLSLPQWDSHLGRRIYGTIIRLPTPDYHLKKCSFLLCRSSSAPSPNTHFSLLSIYFFLLKSSSFFGAIFLYQQLHQNPLTQTKSKVDPLSPTMPPSPMLS